eukprot:12753725-Alexandrium_andersonii.AAC.1
MDLGPIHKRASWPTFSPQTSHIMPPLLRLLRECHRNHELESACMCWLSAFVPSGAVVHDSAAGRVVMSL